MLSEGRREGLHLPLSRSLSEPNHSFLEQPHHLQLPLPGTATPGSSHGPDATSITTTAAEGGSSPFASSRLTLPVFPASPASMPASPCSDSANLQRSLLLRRVRLLEPADVARRLTRAHKPRPFVLLDLRPFFHYNLRHIRSAINLNCSDRFNRKRLQLRRVTVVDLAAPAMREQLKRRGYRDVIAYDESTTDVASLRPDHPVFLVLSALLDDNREPLLLKGGFSDFQKCYPELCDEDLRRNPTSSDCPIPRFSFGFPTRDDNNHHHMNNNNHHHHMNNINNNINNNNNNESMSSGSVSDMSEGLPTHLLSPDCYGGGTLLASPDSEAAIEGAAVTQVLPYLYLGNARDAQDTDLLQALGVQRVLSVTSRVPGYREGSEVLCKVLPALDNGHQNLRQYFPEAIAFIDCCKASGHRVLVHCQAGISRSATVVIAYLMHANRVPMIDAYKTVKNLRSIISPNLNFMGQLVEWEATLRTMSSSSAVLDGSDRTPCHQCQWKMQEPTQVPTACHL